MFWAFLAALAAATVASIFCVDQPLALYISVHPDYRPVFQAMAAPSLLMLPLAGLVLAWAVLQKLRGGTPVAHLWLAMALATLASTTAKDELKWLFGRPWPSSWLYGGLYNFHPLTDDTLYGAFPSGHTAYIAAPLAVLWMLRPKWRVLWAGVVLMVMTGLVGANYHYLGDVLAGLMTGLVCAWGTLVLLGER